MKINGLTIVKDIIDEETEEFIIQELDREKWNNSLKRRTQHYGYEYNYNSKNANKKAPPFPYVIRYVSDYLSTSNIIKAEQCIVNEYNRDQYISKHIDSKIFGPVIVSVSLGEDTNFIFTNDKDRNKSITLEVPRRSMLVMKEDSRYFWTHEIPNSKHYTMNGEKIFKSHEYRRISLTFRTMSK